MTKHYWCLHDDCLRSVTPFRSEADLAAHAAKAHGSPAAQAGPGADDVVLLQLAKEGLAVRGEPGARTDVERPVGHHTHNLLVKDKKSGALFLVAHRQSAKANLADVAKKVKAAFGAHSGCITSLTLLKDVEGAVQWVLDEALVAGDSAPPKLTICTGCANPLDHSQHRVADVPPQQLLAMLAASGHEPVMAEFS